MLWTAIAAMQRTEPDLISVVYSGDVDASKDMIIEKVKVNLPLVYNVSDSYLLMVNLGSGAFRHNVGPIDPTFRLSPITEPG